MATFATLCYVFRGARVLLLLKAKGLFGGGKWNAPGGKLATKESPETGTVREVFEETGLRVQDLCFHGILNFYLGGSKRLDQTVFVFSSRSAKGRLKQSVEGRLSWFSRDQVPYDQMWDDDRVWLPLVFQGKSFVGNFYFSDGYQKLESYDLEEMENSELGHRMSSTQAGSR